MKKRNNRSAVHLIFPDAIVCGMVRRIMGVLFAGITLVLFFYAPMVYAISNVRAEGIVSEYNGSAVVGLWAAGTNDDTGTVVAIFRSDGDMFIVTVIGSVSAGEDLVISGDGYIARNGQILTHEDGISIINHEHAEIRVGEDLIIGQTELFESMDVDFSPTEVLSKMLKTI